MPGNRLNRAHAVAGVAFLSTGLSVGMMSYGFGVFVEPLEASFGWTRAQINGGLSIGFVAALASPLTGGLIDRVGARPVMVAALVLMATAMVARPFMTELWHWYALNGLAALGSSGAALLPAGKLVGVWFPRSRGRMMGTVASGNNLGGAIVVPLATWIVASSGWELAYLVFGFSLIAVSLAVVLVVRERPTASRRHPGPPVALEGRRAGHGLEERQREGGARTEDGARALSAREALRTPLFFLLAAGLTASAFTHPIVVTQLMPHLMNEGMSAGGAATVLTASALVALSSKIIMGWLSERITARNATIVCLLVVSAGIGLFIVAGGSWLVWPAVVVFGLGLGGFGALRSLVVAESFGMKAFGGIMGLFTLLTVVPIIGGPLVAGLIFDATRSYRPAFGVAIGIFLAGAVFFAAAGRAARPAPVPVTSARPAGGAGPVNASSLTR